MAELYLRLAELARVPPLDEPLEPGVHVQVGAWSCALLCQPANCQTGGAYAGAVQVVAGCQASHASQPSSCCQECTPMRVHQSPAQLFAAHATSRSHAHPPAFRPLLQECGFIAELVDNFFHYGSHSEERLGPVRLQVRGQSRKESGSPCVEKL